MHVGINFWQYFILKMMTIYQNKLREPFYQQNMDLMKQKASAKTWLENAVKW